MLKRLINKFKKQYVNTTHAYYRDVLSSLEDTSKERQFEYFLEDKEIDLELYVSFSPEKLLQDYFDYIDPFFKTAKKDLLLISSECIHICALIISPNQAKTTFLYLNQLLDAQILKEKEELMICASVTINNILASNPQQIEKVH